MSSRKKLKKDINHTVELLYTDLIFYKVYVVGADKNAAEKILLKVAEHQQEFLKRVGCSEGKKVEGRVKAYYKKLRQDFQNQINKLAQDINQLP